MSNIWTELKKPFPAASVSWRVGSTNKDKTKGIALAYIDARDVMDRLDDEIGVEGWFDRYEYNGNTCLCHLTVNGLTKVDGSAETTIEGEKGQISKALVRAAVKFGIGRYLYDLGTQWVEIESYGKSSRIKKSEYKKLDAVLNKYLDTGAVEEIEVNPEPKKETVDTRWTEGFINEFKTITTLEELEECWKSRESKLSELNKLTKDACLDLYNAKKKEFA